MEEEDSYLSSFTSPVKRPEDPRMEEEEEDPLLPKFTTPIKLPENPFDFTPEFDKSSASSSPISPFLKTNSSSYPWISYNRSYDEPTGMGAALINLGNTCFLNAILQCFTHTVPFVQSLRSCHHPTPCDRSIEGFCVLCAMRDHVEHSLSSSGRKIEPSRFVYNIKLSSSFLRNRQEDAHEFLQSLLDKLDGCGVNLSVIEQSSFDQEESFVKKIFGGRLRSQVQCCSCGHCSDTFEPWNDLSLEIEDVDSLPTALESFTKVERIEDAKYTCENCKKEVLVVKKHLTLEKTPTVVAFHLKRFKSVGSYVEKIDKHVDYPLELDLLPYKSSQENTDVDSKYELYGVVVHSGISISSGHYYCFIRSSPQKWHKLNDAQVMTVTEELVLSQEAYILFYAKQGTPWFSTLMESQKQCVHTSPNSVLDDVHDCSTLPVEESNITRVEDDAEKIPAVLHAFCDELDKASENVEDCPQTPSPPKRNKFESVAEKGNEMPPSPEIYAKDPPEDSYTIPRGHLSLKKQTPSARVVDKSMEDSKRREAMRLTRSMPSSRAMKFQACMLGSLSEGPINKKRRRLTGGLGREKNSPSGMAMERPNTPFAFGLVPSPQQPNHDSSAPQPQPQPPADYPSLEPHPQQASYDSSAPQPQQPAGYPSLEPHPQQTSYDPRAPQPQQPGHPPMPMAPQPQQPGYAPLPGQPLPNPSPLPLTSGPISVIGQHFCAPYPIDLTIAEKSLSFGEGNFNVTDVNGNLLFQVKGVIFSFTDKRVLRDVAGNPLVTLRQKTLTAHRRWEVYRGESTELLFSVKKSSIIQFTTNLEVYLASNPTKDQCDFKIKGSWGERSCVVYHGNTKNILAQMHKKLNIQSVLFGKDQFGVTVYPHIDYAFIVSLIVILYEINMDRSGQD
ncbi:Ubiquitin carboxyl-terminal hydrolase [Thalictrum thalictroides]|uniref:Ubiquitin carboxyl-terminal hydrolase n=1 Tax=Thalictrum thalictroides TaxID=46969 RepID=A0A7J6X9U3_THATH|nr:Ubiquitin carboxyl-terminal hydrolase [Thalictrum thalictroides]